MAADYLVAAANEMYLTLDSMGDVAPDDIAAAAERGCTAFRRLADDQDFRQYVRILSLRRTRDRAAFAEITGIATASLDHFLFFLTLEQEVMLKGGMEPDLINELTEQARLLVDSIRRWDGDADQLFTKIAQAREQACALATSLRQHQARQDTTRTALRRVGGGMFAVSGLAVVALNASSAFPHLSPAGTAVSGAVGDAIFSWGLDLLRG